MPKKWEKTGSIFANHSFWFPNFSRLIPIPQKGIVHIT